MYRLGAVSFLNAQPLVAGLDADEHVELIHDVPARLPALLDDGRVHAALVPMVDVLRSAGRYRVISDACIGCDGETMTVRVFSQVPPDRMQTLSVDGDSHTSVALAMLLWQELYGRTLTARPLDAGREGIDGLESVLLIGDKVVDPARGSFAYEVDLGGAWREHTGLPFVFAVWAVAVGPRASRGRDDHTAAAGAPAAPVEHAGLGGPALRELAQLLCAARDRGVARAAAIAEADGPRLGWPVELARRYLTRCLRFKLDGRSVAGAELFGRMCAQAGLTPSDAALAWPEDVVADAAS